MMNAAATRERILESDDLGEIKAQALVLLAKVENLENAIVSNASEMVATATEHEQAAIIDFIGRVEDTYRRDNLALALQLIINFAGRPDDGLDSESGT